MNIQQQLNALTQEALEFASIINQHPAEDSDLVQACELFCSYLQGKLEQLEGQLIELPNDDLTQTSLKLQELCELIRPQASALTSGEFWQRCLSTYTQQVRMIHVDAA